MVAADKKLEPNDLLKGNGTFTKTTLNSWMGVMNGQYSS
jgi:hypothetical protein